MEIAQEKRGERREERGVGTGIDGAGVPVFELEVVDGFVVVANVRQGSVEALIEFRHLTVEIHDDAAEAESTSKDRALIRSPVRSDDLGAQTKRTRLEAARAASTWTGAVVEADPSQPSESELELELESTYVAA